jgi:superoxide reductase
MTEMREVYKCVLCGNVVEVIHSGAGELVCCNQPMVLFEEKGQDQGTEKHLPVLEKVDGGVKIKVGDIPHPMAEEHYIEWIEIITGSRIERKYLKAGDVPETFFQTEEDVIEVRSYCNLHGLWKIAL